MKLKIQTLSVKLLVYIKENIPLISIFGIIIFVRLWKVSELFNFTLGEEIQATMAWEQVKNFHPIWIGVSAANINYYLGPGFTYLNAILFKLSAGDPVILAWFSALLGIVTTYIIYFVVKEIISNRVAIFSIIIYGCSMLINLHDRRFWNPTPIPLITMLYVYSLIKARHDTRWFILTASLIGFAFHIHLTLLLLTLPTIVVALPILKKIKISTWILSILAYLIITSPLIVFDIHHNFDNLLMPVRTLLGKQHADLNTFSLINSSNHVKDLLSTFGRIWFIKFNTNPHDEIVHESHFDKTTGNTYLALVTVITLFWFLLKNKKEGHDVFTISIITIILAYIFYPSYNPEYYLMSLLTLISIAIGYCLSDIPRKLAIFVVVMFVCFNMLSTMTLSEKYGLNVRRDLVRKTISALGAESYELQTFGKLPKPHYSYAGWRYLFKHYGRTPVKSNIDPILSWLYPDEISDKKAKILIIVSDTVEPKLNKPPLASFKSGPYRSVIFETD